MSDSLIGQTSYLLGVAAAAIAVLLFLIMKLKVHAFASLIIVSFFTAVATGVAVDKIVPTMLSGFGGTLGSVALLVGLGAMVGKILEVSGGAQVLANTLIGIFGEKRAPLALGLASLLFALPIFFDAGLMVMLPVILSVAKKLGGSLLLYALPATGAFSVMHVFMVPHPGPFAAAVIFGAIVVLLILIGLTIGIPTWFISSYLFGQIIGRKFMVKVPDLFTSEGSELPEKLPRFSTVIAILLTPVCLILLNTGVSTLITIGYLPKDNLICQTLITLGQTPIALTITLLEALVIFHGTIGAKKLNTLCEKALPAICSVILVTGAGGMFGGVLRASGIGDALSGVLSDLGIPVILAGFIISSCLRIAQGSATVAVTTAAALGAPIVSQHAGELSAVDICTVVIAVASGSVVCSHFNDSGFWLFKGLYGLDEKMTLKTWTVLETLIGVIGFTLASIVSFIF